MVAIRVVEIDARARSDQKTTRAMMTMGMTNTCLINIKVEGSILVLICEMRAEACVLMIV